MKDHVASAATRFNATKKLATLPLDRPPIMNSTPHDIAPSPATVKANLVNRAARKASIANSNTAARTNGHIVIEIYVAVPGPTATFKLVGIHEERQSSEPAANSTTAITIIVIDVYRALCVIFN